MMALIVGSSMLINSQLAASGSQVIKTFLMVSWSGVIFCVAFNVFGLMS